MQEVRSKKRKKRDISGPISKMVEAKAVMAPMSGVTDVPFRMMIREFGCKFAFTEMIDVNSIYYKNRKAFRYLDKFDGEGDLGVQIVGQDIGKIVQVAKKCEDRGFELLDLNAGCPARKVIKGGKGSALLKDPGKLGEIIRALVDVLSIPVTVKIRIGWDSNNIEYIETARILEEAGASLICVHPRTREQMYKGRPDHEAVRIIKENLNIPVFASGNIFSVDDVQKVLKETSCDGVFIARGALGRPWIFKELDLFFKGRKTFFGYPDLEFIKCVMQRHFSLNVEYYGETVGMRRMYKNICWYLKKRKNLDAIMKHFRQLNTYEEAKSFIDKINLDDRKHLIVKI